MLGKFLINWCARRDYSALRASPFGAASGLRPTAFNFAFGEAVELGLLSAGSSNCSAVLPDPTKGPQAKNAMVRPERFELPASWFVVAEMIH
jgi:hypothetical protein